MGMIRALSLAARRRDYGIRCPVYVITHDQADAAKKDPDIVDGLRPPPLTLDEGEWLIFGNPVLITTPDQNVPDTFIDLRHATDEPTVWAVRLRCPECGRELETPLTPDSPVSHWMEIAKFVGEGCDHQPTPIGFGIPVGESWVGTVETKGEADG